MHYGVFGGGKGARTPDLMAASHALSQLSYTPIYGCPLVKTAFGARCGTRTHDSLHVKQALYQLS